MRLPEFWMGDEASFEAFVRSHILFSRVLADPSSLPSKFKLFSDGDDEDEMSLTDYLAKRMTAVDGSVGILNISGPLTSDADPFSLLFGAVPYPAVISALDRLASLEDVQSILLNVSSNGGDAVGLDEVSQKIRLVNAQKPVVSWSGSRTLSAGYWLSSSAREAYGSRMAEFGSIGVIATHTSMARMLKDEGLDVTVVRAGKYKALGHPAEKLSEEGFDLMKEKVGKLYGFFVDHVADRRGLSVGSKGSWAEGKTFFGEEAKSVGLIDDVLSLTDVISRLKTTYQPKEQSMPKHIVMSAQAAAAVASGASLEQVPHEEIEIAEQEGSQEPLQASHDSGQALAQDEPGEAQVEQLQAAVTSPAETQMVEFLRAELASVRKENVRLSVELKEAEQRVEAAAGAEQLLRPIAIEATQRMMIGLNQTPMDMTSFSASVVAEQYSKVKSTFEKTFVTGRQSLLPEQAQSVGSPVSPAVARQLGITPKERSTLGTHPTWGR